MKNERTPVRDSLVSVSTESGFSVDPDFSMPDVAL
jgi:hypothetical protein